QEYHAKEEYLVENYRSSRFIIDAASRCIDGAAERLKRDHRLRIDARRQAEPPGGAWTARDEVAGGKVQVLRVKGGQLSQAVAAVEELERLAALDPDWQWNRCAIVARNWTDLDPARSACMVHGIPVQSAREELSSFWRARETQRLLRTLESGDSTAIEAEEIRRYREDAGEGPWADLLAQALDELLLEEGQATVLPIAFVRNWLGEWSKEIRRRQQGLLLTSAHRAKGLEFDHVVILDGRWNAASDAEDPDTARRLYYVSMTRARETLALVRLDDAGRPDVRDTPLRAKREERAASLLQPLGNHPSVLEREVPRPDISDRRLDIRIAECTMKDVVLSFAGWRAAHSRTHRAIAALSPGDPLSLSHEDGQWKVLDREGRQVGRMAKSWTLPRGMTIARASVQGIFTRWADDGEDEERRRTLRSETWEVVVPQFFLVT
ncbi:MAG: ATP-binding domain-containing protein, partial [Gammaproteobacteria bacterium]|nr:ATP-binding domain-containing protein [Gammaproteobacteria bacterium]